MTESSGTTNTNGGDGLLGGGASASVDARERHKLAERERRKSMRELFLSLHSLLPHSHTVRKEQSAILDEIINYIPVATSRLRTLRNRQREKSSAEEDDPQSKNNNNIIPHHQNNYRKDNHHSSSTPPLSSSSSSSSSSTNSSEEGASTTSSSSTVSIRVRGDRVNISITDTSGSACHSDLLSTVLNELDSHHLDLVRSTHCRDGSKLLHYSESKIREEVNGTSPQVLKERLEDLASKLHGIRKCSSRSSSKQQQPSSLSSSSTKKKKKKKKNNNNDDKNNKKRENKRSSEHLDDEED